MKPIHRERLRKLAEYLLTQVPEEKFDMACYRRGDDMDHVCGTAGCALGWSPAIMLESTFRRYKSRSSSFFQLFSRIISKEYFGIDPGKNIWSYIFSEEWAFVDNTPQGAAARILYFLDHGVPDCFDCGENDEDDGYSYDWDTSHYQEYLTTYNNEKSS